MVWRSLLLSGDGALGHEGNLRGRLHCYLSEAPVDSSQLAPPWSTEVLAREGEEFLAEVRALDHLVEGDSAEVRFPIRQEPCVPFVYDAHEDRMGIPPPKEANVLRESTLVHMPLVEVGLNIQQEFLYPWTKLLQIKKAWVS